MQKCSFFRIYLKNKYTHLFSDIIYFAISSETFIFAKFYR